MKVLLLNGSPHAQGCTYTAIREVAESLERNGVGTEIFQIGLKPVTGCMACNKCAETGYCVVNDSVNLFIDMAAGFDGFVFGSPVHYAAASGSITSFLDRSFYAGGRNFTYKPGAVLVSCRRAGSTAALDQLNKYLTINNMPVISSGYWNMVHGFTPDDVRQDLEGMQTMRGIGNNMAWILKCIGAGRQNGVAVPEREARVFTNFIR